MKITEINKLCITALQNLWQITGNNLNLDITIQKIIILVSFSWSISRNDKRWDKSKN